MTFSEALSYINTTFITPLFNFSITFWGGITFGSIVVAIFGLPILVRAFKKLF